jgi:hypothetical protein
MTLNNKNSIRKFGLTDTVSGYGSSSLYYTVGIGWGYVFNVEGYRVVKNVYSKRATEYVVSGKNITEKVTLKTFDMNEINRINEGLRLELVSDIMSSDLTRVKGIMTKNKKGFMHFMDYKMNEEGLEKGLAFGEVVRDFYNNDFIYSEDEKAIIKVMIMYGYEFTNMKDARKIIRK